MLVLIIKRLSMDRAKIGVEWVSDGLNGLVRMESEQRKTGIGIRKRISEQRKTHPCENQIRKDGAPYVFLDFELIVRSE
jgi:hypothetical protein